ncbi:MAG: universal stress protein [Planctomycetota bacterium]
MRVVLAIDGSDESVAAVQALKKMPFAAEAEVTAVTALQESPLDLDTRWDGVSYFEAERNAAEKHLAEVEGELKGQVKSFHGLTKAQHPNQLILHAAENADADLIILGAVGHNALYRVIFGSTAEYVANHAKCSVLIVRKSLGNEDQHRMLLAHDGSTAAGIACEQLKAQNWPRESSLHVMTVLERPKLLPESEVYDPPSIEAFRELLDGLDIGDVCESVERTACESLHIGNRLTEAIDREDRNLVFVGSTGKSVVTDLLLGSVSRHLLHHAKCSVWVARQKTWKNG